MNGFLDTAYAAKAWAAGVVAAVGNVVMLTQVAVADEAISFKEAKGIWVAVTAVGTVLASAYTVFKKRNAPAPR